VFHGCFTLDAALAVGATEPGQEAETIERIGGLVDKSFLAVQPRLGETAYRCLDTTRLYLQPKLEEAGESAAVSQRHAQYYLDVFGPAAALWDTTPVAEARARLLPDLDNLRVAIDWSLGPAGDAATGIALTLAGVPLWLALGLLDETRRRLEAAIAADRVRGAPDPGQSMRLHAALGSCTVFLSGTMEAALAETLRLAEGLDDTEHQLHALNGLALGAMRRDYSEAERHATRFRDLAWSRGQPDDGPVGDRLLGYVLHMTGRQAEARELTEAMLARYPRRSLQPHQNKLNMFDQRILSLGVLARIQWLQGEPAAALALCDATLAEARAIEHPFSQFFALSLMAAPIALLAGDLARAQAAREEMTAGFRQTEGWRLWGEAYLALETLSAGRPADGAVALQAALGAMPDASLSRAFPLFHAGLAQALLDLGRPDDALAAIEAALAKATARHELWFVPEFLRLRGICRLAHGHREGQAAAEGDFRDAFNLAEYQGAGAWALRAATSLARLRPDTTEQTLRTLLARFPATADTPDLRAARAALPG
jgi:predicted ATPase